jgi:glycosyltransferase involved in cell wall biosynthesis
MQVPPSYVVLIPSYNTGAKLVETVQDARRYHQAVWVVIDGSTDGSAQALRALARGDAGIRVMELAQNQGKGAAILHGLIEAVANGYSHVLTMDSDGQHPAPMIPDYLSLSRAHPDALILGKPVFDHTAPRERVIGRRLCNWWVNIETLHAGIGDSLFGMRVYPAGPLLDVMQSHLSMRRFDFDAESAIRLVWRGMRPINIDTPVRYFTAAEGGVSHFRYFRDNVLLIAMLFRLLTGFLVRLPWLLVRRLRPAAAEN